MIIKKKIFLPLMLLILSVSTVLSQQLNFRFEHLTTKDGLSNGTVNVVYQDSRGFLWIGTADGLNRYDGYNFKVYNHNADDSTTIAGKTIYSIYEDDDGALWIGTYSGLSRYDREKDKFKSYLNSLSDSTSISNNNASFMAKDNEGQFWICTYGGGINRFNPQTEEFIAYKSKPDDNYSLPNNNVVGFLKDRKGNFWFGTDDGLSKLIKKQDGSFSFKNYTPFPNHQNWNTVWSIIEDHEGILWIGTLGGGLLHFSPETGMFTQIDQYASNLSSDLIYSLYKDSRNRIWVGTADGLNVYNAETKKFHVFESNPAIPFSISNNKIWSIYEDKSGIIWIGTAGGLDKFIYDKMQFNHYQNIPFDTTSLSNNNVTSIIQGRRGNVWIGTNKGLNLFDPVLNTFKHFFADYTNINTLSNNLVSTVYQDHSGVIWIGTWGGGLNKLNTDLNEFQAYFVTGDEKGPINNHINNIYEDKAGNLWVSTLKGLNKFDRKKETFVTYRHDPKDSLSLSHNFVTAIYEDRKGNIWLGTRSAGLNQLKTIDTLGTSLQLRRKNDNIGDLIKKGKNEYFIHYKKEKGNTNSLSNNRVTCIYENKFGELWIGTYGGLNKLDYQKGTFTRYTTRNGLPNDIICSIEEDFQNNLWISTKNGLCKFNPVKNTFKNYDVDNGLQSNEFNPISSSQNSKGIMYFGGINGFNIFIPDSINDNNHTPKVAITDFKIQNKSIGIGELSPSGAVILTKEISATGEIILPFKDNVFSFDFSALHFISPEKNRYAYKMEGFDQDWIYTDYKRRFATYTNLDPGTYLFKVKASNSDGVWSEESTSVIVKIIPPFWRTIWFRVIIIAGIAFLVFTYYKGRIELIKHQRGRLEKQIQKQTEALRNTNKDLIKQKEEVAKLIDELEKLSVVARETDNAVLIMDNKGNVEWINDGFKRLYGYNLEDLKRERGSNLKDLSTNKDIDKIVESCAKELKTITYESDAISKEGQKFYLQSTLTPIINEKGELSRIIAIETDISRLKKAEIDIIDRTDLLKRKADELTEANKELEHLSIIAEKTDNAILITDENGYFEWVNDSYTRMFGLTLDELKSNISKNIIGQNTPRDVKETIERCLLHQEKVTYEYTTVTHAGNRIWVLANMTPIIGEDGKTKKVIVVDSDITKQKEKEAEILQKNREISKQRDKVRLEVKNVEKAYKEMQLLSEFGQKVTATLNIESIRKMVHEYVLTLMDTASFGIGVYNELKKKIEFHNFYQQGEFVPYFEADITNSNTLSVWSLKNRRTIFISDFHSEYMNYIPAIPQERAKLQPLSVIYVPLMIGRRPIGVITAQSYKKEAYTKKHLTMLQTLATYISVALDAINSAKILQNKNAYINGSNRYARTIQEAILPTKSELEKYFESFVIYRPKEVVSGDFYWLYSEETEGKSMVFLAAIDCTGHGVPGAFMTLIANRLLNEIISDRKVFETDQILIELDKEIRKALRQDISNNNDSIDMCLVRLTSKAKGKYDLSFSGAKRPLIYYQHKAFEFHTLEADRRSVGGHRYKDSNVSFTSKKLEIEKDDFVYLLTDGLLDQHGTDRKRFGSKRLIDVLEGSISLSIEEQRSTIIAALDNYKGSEDQRDDITVLGVKIK